MTIMPFVLIVQLIMCGVLFELEGFTEGVSYITLSKWGMNSFGSVADLNSYKLAINEPLHEAKVLVENYSAMPKPNDFYDHEVSRLLLSWLWIVGITFFNAVVSGIALKIKNRDS